MKYAINFWGSHPDLENDDCWGGFDTDDREKAMNSLNGVSDVDTQFVEVCSIVSEDDKGHQLLKRLKLSKNPDYQPEPIDEEEWVMELAMEAGMLHGVDAYNEMLGWS